MLLWSEVQKAEMSEHIQQNTVETTRQIQKESQTQTNKQVFISKMTEVSFALFCHEHGTHSPRHLKPS